MKLNIGGLKKSTAANSTFAIGEVSCSADSFVVKENAVLRMNICTEKPIANLQNVGGHAAPKLNGQLLYNKK